MTRSPHQALVLSGLGLAFGLHGGCTGDPGHDDEDAIGSTEQAIVPSRPLVGVSSTCPPEAVRWASSSDRIYVDGSAVVCTPRDLALMLASMRALPAADRGLQTVDAAAGVYYLGSNLLIGAGATLLVRGTAAGGDTSELRIRSDEGTGGAVFVRAQYGTIRLERTRVISWDSAAGGPDTNHEDGRAYLQVRSFLEGDTARESRLDIRGSEVAHLGANAAEGYGLSWKVIGAATTSSGASLYDLVNVYGDVIDSKIHHNYFGIYTYGAYGMTIAESEVYNNVQYGVDPHDDSDAITIRNNSVHDNGNHGIISSRRCDGLTIVNNVSARNRGVGIMLHGDTRRTRVAGNQSLDNTDAGLAIFDSHDNVVENNTVLRNEYGIRFSVGASNNVVTRNEFGYSRRYALYFFRGSDPSVTGDSRPRGNRIEGNMLHHGGEPLLLTDGDENAFTDNVFSSFDSFRFALRRGRLNRLEGNKIESNGDPLFELEGTSAIANETRIAPGTQAILLRLTPFSTAHVEGPAGSSFVSDLPGSSTAIRSGTRFTIVNRGSSVIQGRVQQRTM